MNQLLGEEIFDVCVVGAGPAGLTVALECEAAGLSVLLLEAGDVGSSVPVPALRAAHILDTARHASLDVATRNGLGGTSAVWGGRCVPFDDVDFQVRPFVPHSGWPIAQRDLDRWCLKAADYLQCGDSGFVLPLENWPNRSDLCVDTVERLSSHPRLGQRFAEKLRTSPKLKLRLEHLVADLEIDESGDSVRAVKIKDKSSSQISARARTFVLACGGLHTTRLLLKLQQMWPERFGGEDGALGRYYMGHLTGAIATISLQDPSDVRRFDYSRDKDHHWFRRRFTLPSTTQLQHQICNIAFWLGNPPLHDPSHGSAAASSIYLGIRTLGRKSVPTEFFALHGDASDQIRGHIRNILANPVDAGAGIARAVAYRMTTDELRPFFLRNRRGRYALHYHSEQIPNPVNRVKMVGDEPCRSRMSINFKFSEEDALSVIRGHEILDSALRKSGKGYLTYWKPREERLEQVLEQARDGYHQIGCARMSDSENKGVVDRDCRVYGFRNLYLASTAVFPTSGQANPTFLAVALAGRLADHLRRNAVH